MTSFFRYIFILLVCAFGVGQHIDQPTTPNEGTARSRIDAALVKGGVAEVPPGVVEIDRPIVIRNSDGGGIVGRGTGSGGSGGWTQGSSPTVIRYVGPPTDGPVVHFHSAVGGVMRDVVIDANGRAAIGVLFTGEPGWGAGGAMFDRVNITNARVAVQCGNAAGDITCSDITYAKVGFTNCDVGLRTVNHQSVNHTFTDIRAGNVGTVFDFVHGGNLIVIGGHVGAFDLLLRVGTAGVNAGTFRFIGLRPELNGRTVKHSRLVDAPATWFADVVFDGCQETMGPPGGNVTDPLFTVGVGVVVTTRNHVHSARPVVAHVASGMYRDVDSRWPYLAGKALPTVTFKRSGSGYVKVAGATNVWGAPVAGVNRQPAKTGAER